MLGLSSINILLGDKMERLMDKDVFRKALEDAIKGKSANPVSYTHLTLPTTPYV